MFIFMPTSQHSSLDLGVEKIMELVVQFTEITRCPESEHEDAAWLGSGPNAVAVLYPGETDTGVWSVDAKS